MGLFRRDETPRDRPQLLEDLLGELKYLRGRVESLEIEWRDTKDQVRRSYQRLEKAAERKEKADRPCADAEESDQGELELPSNAPVASKGFWEKYQRMMAH